MAAFEQPRTWGQIRVSAPGNVRGNTVITTARGRVSTRLQWVGSIVGGLAVGAAAAFLVGGLVGMHETSTSTVQVGHAVSLSSTQDGRP